MTNATKEQIISDLKSYYKKNKKSPTSTKLEEFTFNKNDVKRLFGKWSLALKASNLPLNRNKAISSACTLCGKEFVREYKEVLKSKNLFCSYACNGSYNTTGRKHTEETKAKISESLKKKRIFVKNHKEYKFKKGDVYYY